MDHRRLFFGLSGVVSDKCNAMHKELLMWGTISLVERASQGWALVSVLILRGIHLSEAEKEEEKSVWVASRTSQVNLCVRLGRADGREVLSMLSFPRSNVVYAGLTLSKLWLALHRFARMTHDTRNKMRDVIRARDCLCHQRTWNGATERAAEPCWPSTRDAIHMKEKKTTSYAPGTYGCLFF